MNIQLDTCEENFYIYVFNVERILINGLYNFNIVIDIINIGSFIKVIYILNFI